MPEDDLTYYQRRAQEEDRAVRASTSEAARDRHLELAAAYRLRCAVNSNSTNVKEGKAQRL